MQHISVLAVGKAAPIYVKALEEYEKRLGGHCHFCLIEVPPEPLNEKNASPAQIKAALEKEGQRLLLALPKAAALVALCVEGQAKDSAAFAQMLAQKAQSGAASVAFAIGSSHGLCQKVKDRAFLRLSLSCMTMPHQLARLVLYEQIYRAVTIQSGMKYHK